MERLSLYKKIAASLELLEINNEQPAHDDTVAASATAGTPESPEVLFIMETEKVTKYCRALTQVLLNGSAETDTELTLIDLLFDLVDSQVEALKAPRYRATFGKLIRVR